MLSVESLHVSIQSVAVLRGLSLSVNAGQMVGLVGRNGAGKTTLLRSLMGHLPPSQGRMSFDGHDLAALPAHARAGLGIGYMPEDRGLVPELTVEENILLPVWTTPGLREADRLSLVWRVLPELLEMRQRRALLLSGGQQKLVALARALAVGTRLLLLDEPFEGVAPALSKRLGDVIVALRRTPQPASSSQAPRGGQESSGAAQRFLGGSGVAVLIAQSDLNHARSIVDAEVVIERGANLVPVA